MSDEEPEQIRKLFIGGLSYNTTEESLSDFFSQWGELTDCVVMQDPSTKRSRGFGFVTFSHAHMVDDCMNNRPHKLDNREVEAKRAVSREESHKPGIHKSVKRMFMGGVKEPITEEDVTNYFSSYGKVESVELLTDKASSKKRGFGFVNFDDYDVVDKIVQTRRHVISGVSIEVAKAFSKEDQTRRAYNQYGNYGWDAYAWGGFRGGRGMPPRGRGQGRRPNMARGGQFDGYWYGRNGHGFQNAHINGGRGDYNPYHSYHYGPPHGYTWPHDNSYGYQMPQEKWNNGSWNYGTGEHLIQKEAGNKRNGNRGGNRGNRGGTRGKLHPHQPVNSEPVVQETSGQAMVNGNGGPPENGVGGVAAQVSKMSLSGPTGQIQNQTVSNPAQHASYVAFTNGTT